MSEQRAWLVDASIYIFRAWFSLPDRWHSSDGYSLNAVYGYAGFLLDFLARTDAPDYCAAAFDESLGTCFRHDIDPGYKASRELPDEALAFQLDSCRALTESLGIPCYGGPRYEADDYLATLARLCREQGLAVTVVTRDKDLGQLLVGADDHWWDFAADQRLDVVAFAERFGVSPGQFADYQALVGDSVDDIRGVPGVGPKTAAQLLQAFGDLASLQQRLDEVATLPIRGAARIRQRLQEHWPEVELARQLTGLEDAIGELDQAPGFVLQSAAVEKAAAFLRSLGLETPLTRRYDRLAQELAV